MHLLLSPLLLTLALTTARAAKTCYYPDGTPGPYTPCNESAEESACCDPGDACLSNGYCFQQGNGTAAWYLRLARGMCTNWSSPECQNLYCKDIAVGGTTSVHLVNDTASGAWCCSNPIDPSNNLCTLPTDGSLEPFVIPPGQVIVDRSTGATLGGNFTLRQSTTSNATVTATPHSNSNNSVAVGAGVGVPLGILLLASLAAVAFLYSKLKSLQKEHHQLLAAQPHESVEKPTDSASDPASQLHEMKSSPVQEAPVYTRAFELTAEPLVNEAPGSLGGVNNWQRSSR